MKTLVTAVLALVLSNAWARAQIGLTLRSLEALIAKADLVVRGKVVKAVPGSRPSQGRNPNSGSGST